MPQSLRGYTHYIETWFISIRKDLTIWYSQFVSLQIGVTTFNSNLVRYTIGHACNITNIWSFNERSNGLHHNILFTLCKRDPQCISCYIEHWIFYWISLSEHCFVFYRNHLVGQCEPTDLAVLITRLCPTPYAAQIKVNHTKWDSHNITNWRIPVNQTIKPTSIFARHRAIRRTCSSSVLSPPRITQYINNKSSKFSGIEPS